MTGAFLFFRCRRFCVLTPRGRSAVGRTSAFSAAQTRTIAIILFAGLLPSVKADCWFEWTAPYAPRRSHSPLYQQNASSLTEHTPLSTATA